MVKIQFFVLLQHKRVGNTKPNLTEGPCVAVSLLFEQKSVLHVSLNSDSLTGTIY